MVTVQVKLGPSYFIPDGRLGTFGGVTPIKGLVPKRQSLFDVAAAGPIAGGAVSLALLLTGLVLSTGADHVRHCRRCFLDSDVERTGGHVHPQ